MTIYWAVGGLAWLMAWLSDAYVRTTHVRRGHESRWSLFDLGAIGVLVAFSALRLDVGTDFRAYLAHYVLKINPDSLSATLAQTDHELGFTMVEFVTRRLFDSPYAIFWTTAALTVVPAYVAIKRLSTRPHFSVALYILLGYYTLPMNIVRQGVAVSLVFLAYSFVRKSMAVSVLLVAVAGTMHTSAFIMGALVLILAWRAPSLRTTSVALIVAAVVGSAFVQLGWVAEIAGRLSLRYEDYLQLNDAGVGTRLTIVFRVALLLYLAAVGAGRADADAKRLLVIAALGTILLFFGTANAAITRLDTYFGIFLVVAIPNVLRSIGSRWPVYMGVVVMASVYFVFDLSYFGGLLPYQTQ